MNFADMWNKAAGAEKKQFGNDDMPDGTYITEVISCKLGKTKDQSKDMVSWNLKVIQGEQKKNHIFVHRPFSKTDMSEQNEKAIQRALNDFIDLELSADTEQLAKTMRDVVGKNVEIKLVAGTNGQFKNFKRIVDVLPVEVVPTVNAEVVSEEDPF